MAAEEIVSTPGIDDPATCMSGGVHGALERFGVVGFAVPTCPKGVHAEDIITGLRVHEASHRYH